MRPRARQYKGNTIAPTWPTTEDDRPVWRVHGPNGGATTYQTVAKAMNAITAHREPELFERGTQWKS